MHGGCCGLVRRESGRTATTHKSCETIPEGDETMSGNGNGGGVGGGAEEKTEDQAEDLVTIDKVGVGEWDSLS